MPLQAKANLSALIESTQDLIWSVDLEYRLIAFNKALEQDIQNTFGVQLAAGMVIHEVLPPLRAALWPPFYERALSTGPFRTEYMLLSGRVIEFSFNPIVDDEKAIGISVFGKDITEREQAEEALRENLELLKEAQTIGSLGSYALDVPAGVWTSSVALDEIFGIGPEYPRTVAGWEALIHPDDRNMITAYFEEEVIGKRQNFNKEYRIIRQTDHAERCVHGIGRLQLDAQGRPWKMHGVIKDITDRKLAEKALRASEERYRTVFQTSLDAVCMIRLSDEMIVDVNQSLLDILGYEREDVVGTTAQELEIFADDRDRQAVLELLRQNGICRAFEVRFRKKNGETGWGRLSSSIVEIGGVAFILSMVQDISEAKAATDALRTSELRYRTAFQTSLDAICITRISDGMFVDVNQSLLDILGYERAEVIGKTAQELGIWVNNRDREAMVEIISQSSICRALEVQFRRKNGSIVWGEISASAIEVDGIPCLLSLTRDMTPVRTAERTIKSLAFYDPLTGLLNRRQLLEQLNETLAAGTQSGYLRALLLLDLDNFKALKEIHGYRAVDILLMEVARRIAACARTGDSVYRIGGDQFVMILESLSKVPREAAAQATIVGERILDAIGRPYMIEGRECLATTCLGVTVFGDRLSSTDEIMKQADIALHEAKAAGDGVARFFSPALQVTVNARAALEEELRQGIKTKQFMLYYQPQVDRGRIMGAEALIRWNHPVRGLVLPDEFIPLAEKSRLILPLGDWVLEAACEQIAAWGDRPQTSHLVLSVNISILQFRQPEFVEHVLAALNRARANPRNLRLELTESMLVDDIDQIIAKMAELKFHGLRFSLDDFGTGYSSLAYLKRLPLDQLKIDRSFVRDILVDAASVAIARAIISLGQAMGLAVVAEGVETEEQWG